MTQEEFNTLMDAYFAEHLNSGYYTSKYSGEEIDDLLDYVYNLKNPPTPPSTEEPSTLTINTEDNADV